MLKVAKQEEGFYSEKGQNSKQAGRGKAAAYGLRCRGFMPVASGREISYLLFIGLLQNASSVFTNHSESNLF